MMLTFTLTDKLTADLKMCVEPCTSPCQGRLGGGGTVGEENNKQFRTRQDTCESLRVRL